MNESIYVGVLTAFLLVSALCHILFPAATGRWMSRVGVVRCFGAILLLFALPCLWWRGWYFWTLFVGLAASGAWRLFFPGNSIRAQEKTYPRWVHGCLLLAGAIGVWTLRP